MYVIGVVGVTMVGNVPLNERLAAEAGVPSARAVAVRADLEDRWNILNLVRTGAGTGSLTLATVALGASVRLQGRRNRRSRETRGTLYPGDSTG